MQLIRSQKTCISRNRHFRDLPTRKIYQNNVGSINPTFRCILILGYQSSWSRSGTDTLSPIQVQTEDHPSYAMWEDVGGKEVQLGAGEQHACPSVSLQPNIVHSTLQTSSYVGNSQLDIEELNTEEPGGYQTDMALTLIRHVGKNCFLLIMNNGYYTANFALRCCGVFWMLQIVCHILSKVSPFILYSLSTFCKLLQSRCSRIYQLLSLTLFFNWWTGEYNRALMEIVTSTIQNPLPNCRS